MSVSDGARSSFERDTANMSSSSSAGTTLSGKAVLITGAAKRVGAAIARAWHGEGGNVIIHYRQSANAAEALAAELNARRPSSAAILPGNLLDIPTIPSLVAAATRHFGRLDALINNASSFYPTPLGHITEAQWDDLIGTNLKAPLFLAQAAAPHLTSTAGLIVNLVDIHGKRPLKQHPVYCAAKAGLIMLTQSLARELGPQVRVNAIAPGPVLWPEAGIDAELEQQIIAATALKRAGSPEDIARTVLFFAKDAPYVTGQVLAVDGGRSIGW
jgi:pteridine reductase